jgi:hypothetical protein
MNKLRTLLGIAAVLAICGLGIWFFLNFERVPNRQYVGMSGEARVRHFLAAERFAERMGMRVKELRSIPDLDAVPKSAVLLLPNLRQGFDVALTNRLHAWVRSGGHLIVEAENADAADLLFARLGVLRARDQQFPKPVPVKIPGSERRLSVSFSGTTRLAPQQNQLEFSAGSPGVPKLLSFALGKGRVTAAATLDFARNASIGNNDHGEFLWHLLRLSAAGDLQVYFRPERLSLWRFLADNAAAALVSAALLLALWLARVAPRFGPLVPDPPLARRRLLDHLRASGRYFWSNGLRSRLTDAAREAVLRRVTRLQPDFLAAPPAEQTERLAALAQITRVDAAHLLAAQGELRGADFIRLMHSAQCVHMVLDRGDSRVDRLT